MSDYLTAQDWIDFALKVLARQGFDALKADVLARKLHVSRGSFYWHFTDLGDFHARVITHWKQTATEAIIADIERYESPEERFEALLRRAFGHSAALEVRMRFWAESKVEAERAVGEIDRRRCDYMRSLLVAAHVAPPLAATRAELVYWTYLGAALGRTKLTGERLERIVTELSRVALDKSSDR